MARFPRLAEGTCAVHYPELDPGPVSFEDSISPEFYEFERGAIFWRARLNVERVEQLPRDGTRAFSITENPVSGARWRRRIVDPTEG